MWEKVVTLSDINMECSKCGEGFIDGDTMVRHRKSGGKTRAYHKLCYERLYQ